MGDGVLALGGRSRPAAAPRDSLSSGFREVVPLPEVAVELEEAAPAAPRAPIPSATGWRRRMPASSMIAAVSAESSPPSFDAVDERLVDLQDVDREPSDVVQRGVAGAEVVDRELDAELLQLRAAARSRVPCPPSSRSQ